jgi:hypothetical protein
VPIFKYAKVLILAPAIGSAAIGIVGLLVLGGVLIAGRGHLGNRAPGERPVSTGLISRGLPTNSHAELAPGADIAVSNTQLLAPGQRSKAGELSNIKNQRAGNAPRRQADSGLYFTSSISRSQFAFLKDYAGRAASDADGKQKVRMLVGVVAPYTPYHFGTDFPLPQVLSTLLLNEPQPIEIRDARYAMMSGIRNAIHKRAGFLWVDMREGFALGAIYFDPSNGEPSPTVTIFSRQLDRKTVRMSHLPRAFVEDLSRWAALEELPPITTRYFIGASGDKYVLKHEENFCEHSEGVATPSPKGVCEKMNAQAAIIDMTATRFLEQTHNASNATIKMIASTGQVK